MCHGNWSDAEKQINAPSKNKGCHYNSNARAKAPALSNTLRMVAKIPVGDEPAEAETSLDGRYCFITSRGPKANTVSVISYRKRREVKRIRVGRHPQEEQEARLPSAVLRRGGFLPPH